MYRTLILISAISLGAVQLASAQPLPRDFDQVTAKRIGSGSDHPLGGSFLGLGNFGDDSYVSRAHDVSRDGMVVVGGFELAPNVNGFITEEAFVWRPDTGSELIGFLPGGVPGASTAFGVSSRGGHVVGQSTSSFPYGDPRAFRWSPGGEMQHLGLSGDVLETKAVATSRRGRYSAGTTTRLTDGDLRLAHNATYWTEGSVLELGSLVAGGSSTGADISADGQVVVGSSNVPIPAYGPFITERTHEPFVWNEDDGMVGLGHLPYVPTDVPNAFADSYANGVSADGQVVVGSSAMVWNDGRGNLQEHAFRWTADEGMVGLGSLILPCLACEIDYQAVDISFDGEIIVGNAQLRNSSEPVSMPFYWTETDGMRLLSDVMVNDYGIDVLLGDEAWSLGTIAAISDDGSTIVGTGTNPEGIQEAWRLVFTGGSDLGAGSLNYVQEAALWAGGSTAVLPQLTTVPEPVSSILVLLGLGLLGHVFRRP